MNFRQIFFILSIYLSLGLSYAVEVVRRDELTNEGVSAGFRNIIILIFTLGVIFLLFVGGCILFIWILIKIWRKLSEHQRRKKSLVYDLFVYDLAQCHYNYDSKLKKRNWKLFFLFWKMREIYIETEKGSLETIGKYYGECKKKEGFYLLAVYNKVGVFKYVGQIIIIPYEIKDLIVKKIDRDKNRIMFLTCEGIDRLAGSDYYYIPLIKDPKKNNKFLDFTDQIHKNYIEIDTYRDIIIENLSSYRQGIVQSVETNPFVHFGRRGGESFKK